MATIDEQQERERIVRTFTADVPLEQLRRIAETGGLADLLDCYARLGSFFVGVCPDRIQQVEDAGRLVGLLASHAALVSACNLALPYLRLASSRPSPGAARVCGQVQSARDAGQAFYPSETPPQ